MKADQGSYAILPAERDTNQMVPLSPFSIFRRSPGQRCRSAFRNSLDLARHLNALGYRPHWMVKHPNLVRHPERGDRGGAGPCGGRNGNNLDRLRRHQTAVTPLLSIAEQFGTPGALTYAHSSGIG